MKFEITATPLTQSSLAAALGKQNQYVAKVNGHNYSTADTAEEAIAKAAKLLAEELTEVSAEALLVEMAAEGDFEKGPFARALAAK